MLTWPGDSFSIQAEFQPTPGRDPVGLLIEQARSRIPELVPVRHGRMLVSPFTFFRGAALPMAADLAAGPDTGLRVQLCGDAHLSNFGAFGSPERRLVFDVNDFDETLPGPFEWDVDDTIKRLRSRLKKRMVKQSEAIAARSRTRDSTQAAAKLTRVVDGHREIVSDPPLIVPIEDLPAGDWAGPGYANLRTLIGDYTRTLPPDRQYLVRQFRLTRVARKVVGVGSVGTQAWIMLMEADDGQDPLLLQAKQAQRSVLAAYVGEARTDYYVRQLRDWKYPAPIEQFDPAVMASYAELCGWTLARAHARTGDRIAIAAYLGGSSRFEAAVTGFAVTYADQTVRDHAALADAVADGRIQAETGV